MKRWLIVLSLMLASPVWAQALNDKCTVNNEGKKCKLQWTGNTEPDMDHYELSYGSASGIYDHPSSPFIIPHPDTDVADVSTTLSLGNGVYYMALKAVDTSGNQSGFTPEVILTVDMLAPGTPTNFEVVIVPVP